MEEIAKKTTTSEVLTGVPVPNRDMFIQREVLELFADLRPILHNEAVETFFAQEEKRANKFKVLFVSCGTVCLVAVCLLLILLSWRLSLVALSKQFPLWVDYVSALAGIVALVLQILISTSHARAKWLYARFAAELTRQWKYQMFLDGQFISKLPTSVEEFNSELADRWTLFRQRFTHGMGAVAEFMEASPFEFLVTTSTCSAGALFDEVRGAYQTFRLDVQTAHLADRNLRLRTMDHWTDALAKGSLVMSGLIAIVDAGLWGSHAMGWIDIRADIGNLRTLTAILAGSALSFAVISAGTRVYRSASAITEERERYRFKELHLRRVEERLKFESEPAKVLSLMKEAETVCTEELQEFLRSLMHADYFF